MSTTSSAEAVALVRERFGGKITYASIPLERVDWTPFDIVSVDLYRSAEIADQFADGVRSLVAQGKPVAITEFGSASLPGRGRRGRPQAWRSSSTTRRPARRSG